jgi:uncharacterized OB-fold protein
MPDVQPAPRPAALAAHEGRLLAAAEIAVAEDGSTRLRGVRCADCGLKVFPVTDVCPACLSSRLEALPLSSEGRLYCYTTVHVAPPGWQTPYVVGYVDMPEGVRLFGKVRAPDPGKLRVDMPVAVVVDAADGGYRYCFEPRP